MGVQSFGPQQDEPNLVGPPKRVFLFTPEEVRSMLAPNRCTFDEAILICFLGGRTKSIDYANLTVDFRMACGGVDVPTITASLRKHLQYTRREGYAFADHCLGRHNVGRPDTLSAQQLAKLMNLTLSEYVWFAFDVGWLVGSFGHGRFWLTSKEVAEILNEFPTRKSLFDRFRENGSYD